MIAGASLFTDHKISGLPVRAKNKKEQSFDNSPTDPISSSSLNPWSSMHGVATLKKLLSCFCFFFCDYRQSDTSPVLARPWLEKFWRAPLKKRAKPLLPAMANSHLKGGPASFQTSHHSHKHGANAMKESPHPKQPQCSHCKQKLKETDQPTQLRRTCLSLPSPSATQDSLRTRTSHVSFRLLAVPGTTCPGPCKGRGQLCRRIHLAR